jgi:hypothetical protein
MVRERARILSIKSELAIPFPSERIYKKKYWIYNTISILSIKTSGSELVVQFLIFFLDHKYEYKHHVELDREHPFRSAIQTISKSI